MLTVSIKCTCCNIKTTHFLWMYQFIWNIILYLFTELQQIILIVWSILIMHNEIKKSQKQRNCELRFNKTTDKLTHCCVCCNLCFFFPNLSGVHPNCHKPNPHCNFKKNETILFCQSLLYLYHFICSKKENCLENTEILQTVF